MNLKIQMSETLNKEREVLNKIKQKSWKQKTQQTRFTHTHTHTLQSLPHQQTIRNI